MLDRRGFPNIYMKKLNLTYITLFLLLFISFKGYAQTPASCFEIESILVDACGSPEWENEMVRFRVGSSALNVNDIDVDWPNNPFRGICQNATTASKVATLNSTIEGCGFLQEPVGGILPAGAKVLFFTDVNVSTTANSFTNLNDTLYAIFQCSGNAAGHFVNYSSGSSTRTLIITFNSPAGCTDQVTYDKSLLVNQSGNPGGSTQDGSRVDFAWNGNPTYTNLGCQAPFTPITASAGANTSICPSGSATFNGIATGEYTSVSWSGGSGTFSEPSNDTTSYIPGAGEFGTVILTMTVTTPCNEIITSNVSVFIESLPTAAISLSSGSTICEGSSVTLTASGGSGTYSYSWSDGSTNQNLSASNAGTYTVFVTSICGSDNESVTITVNPLPVASISGDLNICAGESTLLTASGGDSFLWSTGETTNSININNGGTYSVTTTNSCGNDNTIATITESSVNAAFTADTITGLAPLKVVFTNSSTGASVYSWTFGNSETSTSENPSHTFNQAGNYQVILTAANTEGCIDTTSLTIVVINPVSKLVVPNVFTPNNDQKNDLFVLENTAITELQCEIFDRWGIRIARFSDPNAGWDGKTDAGSSAPTGTYFYVIKAKGLDNVEYLLTDSFMLFR